MLLGLIPAHAGKTTATAAGLMLCRAHPRSRGENGGDLAHLEISTGSSPLTRGKPSAENSDMGTERLIPAHAGKTGGPHVVVEVAGGSSPLTRGKRSRGRSVRLHYGLIPAHAGKTPDAAPASRRSGAHPRSRGENDSCVNGRVGLAGSSPLTRGKLLDDDHRGPARGLIPAHAGKTWWCRLCSQGSRAHPRSRGENR